MSVVGLSSSSSSDNMFKKSTHHHHHRRNDSGELDVFEAAKYFSGHANNEIYNNNTTSVIKDYNYNHHHYNQEKRRLSLDVPMIRNAISTQTIGGGGHDNSTVTAAAVLVMDHHHHHEKKIKQNVVVTKDNKKLQNNNNNNKQRQPSSPGGRLANFLNSLFNQKSIIPSSRNKKSISTSNHDREIISPAGAGGTGWRRKRRSSISHFGTTTTTTMTTTTTTTTNTTTTPNKSYKDLNQHVMVANLISSSSNSRPATRTSTTKLNIIHNNSDDHDHYNNLWLNDHDQKRDHDQFLVPKNNIIVNDQVANWAPEKEEEEEEKELMFKKFNDDDYDGEDSDSSSDLFELPNYDLGSCFSSDLPVYETTNMDSIKKSSTTISAATTR